MDMHDLIDIDALVADARRVELTFAGRHYVFEYAPSRWDVALQAEIEQLNRLPEDNPARHQGDDRFLAKMLTSWNVASGGAMAPISAESLDRLALPLRRRMAAAIMQDLGVGEAPKLSGGSSNGSSAGASGATAPNGIASSEPVSSFAE